jgi:catechol 2,3-dioxygenase-like lactoylglutathione lyase family enzyme
MKLVHDHIHCVHSDVDATVNFYKDIHGGIEKSRIERGGAPPVVLDVHGSSIIVRGKREGETVAPGPSGWPRYSIDHYAFRVEGKLSEAVEEVKGKGGYIVLEGEVEDLRFAYLEGPDGVIIELVELK